MTNKKVCTLKGMTIAENLIAFVLLIAALTISGTGFYTAGNFINKGRMYSDASDRAQVFMESGIVDEVAAAFKEGYDTTKKNNKFDSTQMQNKLKNLSANGYEYSFKYSSKSKYYYNEDSLIIIKPFSSDDTDIDSTYKNAMSQNKTDSNKVMITDPAYAGAVQKSYNTQSGNITAIDDKLSKLGGMYLYIGIPVDPEEVREVKKNLNCGWEEAITASSYVPLVCYIEDWPY